MSFFNQIMRALTVSAVAFILLFAGLAQGQILKPVKWKFETKSKGKFTELYLIASIEPHWHLYSQFIGEGGPIPTSFKFEKNVSIALEGKVEERSKVLSSFDKNFNMDLKYFEQKAVFVQKISVLKPTTVKGSLEFMVCDDKQCLPPDEIEFSFKVEPIKGTQKAESTSSSLLDTAAVSEKPSESTEKPEQSSYVETKDSNASKSVSEKNTSTVETTASINATSSEKKEDQGFGMFLVFAFLGGLAAVLTPCVFPMLPMTVTFFTKQSENSSKGIRTALIFGGSIILIYSLIGALFGVLGAGADFANWLSTHWLPNILFFIIFIVFALSFLGLFEITLPHGLVNKIDQKSDMKSLVGVFFMAFTLVLVSFSCTGPIVGSLLIEAVGGQVMKPVLGMASFSFGIALPFMLFAAFPSMLTNLPKSGGWLNAVKVVLGLLELALAFKFLSIADQVYHWGILDREVYLCIWIVISGILGLYLLGKIKLPHDSELKTVGVPRLILAIASFSFMIYLIPGLWGAPLRALSGYLPPQTSLDFDLYNQKGNSQSSNSTITEEIKFKNLFHLPHQLEGFFDYKQALAYSKKVNKPLFIDFTGHGCVNCREMEANVWSNPEVLRQLREDFVIVALYVDDKTELPESDWYASTYDNSVKKTIGKQNSDLQVTKFNGNSQPYYFIVDNEGNILGKPHAYDKNVSHFLEFLNTGKKLFKK